MGTPLTRSVSSFPVEWAEVHVTGQAFTLDSPDDPAPSVPLEATAAPWIGTAMVDGFRAHAIPVRDAEMIYVNYYEFRRMVIDQPTAEQVAEIEQAVRDVIAVQMDRWLGEYRPRVETLIASLKAFDAETPALSDLPAHLEAMDAAQAELWAIHFRIVVGMLLSMQGFGEFYADLFEAPQQEAYELLAGGLSEGLMTGIAIADLADRARELRLDEIILQTPDGDVMAALGAAPGGGAFLADLDAFLERYGYRQDSYRMTSPTWVEEPWRAIMQVRACLRGEVDARARQAGVARKAAAAADRARERLALYPQPVWEQFEALLEFARQGAFLEEEHHFFIDQHSMALLRLTYLEVGRRLAREHLLDAPDDVLMLERDELLALLRDPEEARATGWPRRLADRRRRELEVAATLTPPPFLGDPATTGESADNLISRALRNHFGGPPVASDRPGELRGIPASAGTVTGRARVARSLHEAQDLRPGEILVAITTQPPWTPLFGVAGAVVAETGGALSHCAIAAREYGIPAVVGVHGATRAIPNGATVTVDGVAGIVRIDG